MAIRNLYKCTLGVVLAASISTVLQAGEVNPRASAQAQQLLLKQFPKAENIEVAPYSAISSNPTIHAILNAATLITFTLEGDSAPFEAIMLPDGEHLILGAIQKPGADVDSPANTQALHLPSPVTTGPRAVMDRYRVNANDLTGFDKQPTPTPDAFYDKLQAHTAITTGNGPQHLYIFTDPNCPNCRAEFSEAAQHEQDFTFHWIPIYAVTPRPEAAQIVLNSDDAERNRANLAVLMKNPRDAQPLALQLGQEVGEEGMNQVAANIRDRQLLFHNLKDKRTPITLYRNKDGLLTKVHGHSPLLFGLIKADSGSGEEAIGG